MDDGNYLSDTPLNAAHRAFFDAYLEATQAVLGCKKRLWKNPETQGDVLFDLSFHRNQDAFGSMAYLKIIEAKTLGAGDGKAGIEWLKGVAGRCGVAIMLDASPLDHSPLSEAWLKEWYVRQGFVRRGGSVMDWRPESFTGGRSYQDKTVPQYGADFEFVNA